MSPATGATLLNQLAAVDQLVPEAPVQWRVAAVAQVEFRKEWRFHS
jgi:hypothetical protein